MFPALHSVYRLHALPLHRLLSNTQDNPLSFHPINKHPHASENGCVRAFPFFLLKNRHAPKKQMTPRRTDDIISAKASDTKPQRRNCNETTFDCLCPCCFFDKSYGHRSVGKKRTESHMAACSAAGRRNRSGHQRSGSTGMDCILNRLSEEKAEERLYGNKCGQKC